MSDKPKTELDYEQIRNDVSSAMGAGDMEYPKSRKPQVVRVSPDRLAACRRVSSAMLADEYLTVLSACAAEGITRGTYAYVRGAGLI